MAANIDSRTARSRSVRPGPRAACLWPLALAAGLGASSAGAAVVQWSGGAGVSTPFWDLGPNWLDGLGPLGGDAVELGTANTTLRSGLWNLLRLNGSGALSVTGGTLSLASASSSGGLLLGGGVVGGGGSLVLGSLAWTGGSLGGPAAPGGLSIVNGPATLAANGHSVNYGHALELRGDSTLAGNGQLFIGSAGTIGAVPYGNSQVTLAAGKTLTVQSASTSTFLVYGGGTFVNAGTVTMAGSTSLLAIDTAWANLGTINVAVGELRFGNTRTLAGRIDIAAGATLRLAGGTTVAPGLVLANAGSVVFDGSYNLLPAGTLAVASTSTLNGGALGGAGTWALDSFNWNGGTLGYSESLGGKVTVSGNTTLNQTSHSLVFGTTLQLDGNAVWGPSGQLFIDGAGLYNNQAYGASTVKLAAGKTLSLQGGSALSFQIYGGGGFDNAGTVVQASPGSTLFLDGRFNNAGVLRADSGQVQVGGTLDNTGLLHANGSRITTTSPGALVQWQAASQTLTGGSWRVTGTQPIALNLGFVAGSGAPALIRTNRAQIELEGAGAAIIVTTTSPNANALGALASNQGALVLRGGAVLSTSSALDNGSGGTLALGAGSALSVGGVYTQSAASGSSFIGGTLGATSLDFAAGVLSAGSGSGAIGSGVIDGAPVVFGDALVFQLDVGAGAWDSLVVSAGSLSLDGTLVAALGAGVEAGTYRFLTTTGGTVSGQFDTLLSNLDPAAYLVTAVYGANHVDLVVTSVGEPQTYVLLALGLLLIGWRAGQLNARSEP